MMPFCGNQQFHLAQQAGLLAPVYQPAYQVMVVCPSSSHLAANGSQWNDCPSSQPNHFQIPNLPNPPCTCTNHTNQSSSSYLGVDSNFFKSFHPAESSKTPSSVGINSEKEKSEARNYQKEKFVRRHSKNQNEARSRSRRSRSRSGFRNERRQNGERKKSRSRSLSRDRRYESYRRRHHGERKKSRSRSRERSNRRSKSPKRHYVNKEKDRTASVDSRRMKKRYPSSKQATFQTRVPSSELVQSKEIKCTANFSTKENLPSTISITPQENGFLSTAAIHSTEIGSLEAAKEFSIDSSQLNLVSQENSYSNGVAGFLRIENVVGPDKDNELLQVSEAQNQDSFVDNVFAGQEEPESSEIGNDSTVKNTRGNLFAEPQSLSSSKPFDGPAKIKVNRFFFSINLPFSILFIYLFFFFLEFFCSC